MADIDNVLISEEEILSFDNVVTVVAGANSRAPTLEKSFIVHESVLTRDSPFFKAALSRNWREAQDRRIELPEDDPAMVQLYIQLIYTGRIAAKSEDTGSGDDSSIEDGGSDFDNINMRLCYLYLFAEKVQNPRAKTSIIKALIEYSGVSSGADIILPGVEPINIIYEATPKKCAARKLLVDMYVYHGIAVAMCYEDADAYPKEFLFDLSGELMKRRDYLGTRLQLSHYLES